MKISYSQLEQILQKIGYPKNQLEKFRQKFAENFFFKVGRKLENKLSLDQQKKLSEMMKNKNTKIGDISEYLKTQDLKNDTKNIIQEVLDEILNYTLEQMIKHASPQEVIIINQTLKL